MIDEALVIYKQALSSGKTEEEAMSSAIEHAHSFYDGVTAIKEDLKRLSFDTRVLLLRESSEITDHLINISCKIDELKSYIKIWILITMGALATLITYHIAKAILITLKL